MKFPCGHEIKKLVAEDGYRCCDILIWARTVEEYETMVKPADKDGWTSSMIKLTP